MAISLVSLWLPILVTVAALFVASSVIWMMLPIHKKDYGNLGEHEGKMLHLVRSGGLKPGFYMFPYSDHSKTPPSPERAELLKSGPFGTVCIMPGVPNMGKMLGAWVFNLTVVTVLIAYVAAATLPQGTEFMKVFQIVCTVAMLAHGGSMLTDSIWKGRPWSHLPGAFFDAAVYTLLTATTFSWLWPKITLPV